MSEACRIWKSILLGVSGNACFNVSGLSWASLYLYGVMLECISKTSFIFASQALAKKKRMFQYMKVCNSSQIFKWIFYLEIPSGHFLELHLNTHGTPPKPSWKTLDLWNIPDTSETPPKSHRISMNSLETLGRLPKVTETPLKPFEILLNTLECSWDILERHWNPLGHPYHTWNATEITWNNPAIPWKPLENLWKVPGTPSETPETPLKRPGTPLKPLENSWFITKMPLKTPGMPPGVLGTPLKRLWNLLQPHGTLLKAFETRLERSLNSLKPPRTRLVRPWSLGNLLSPSGVPLVLECPSKA